MPTIKRKNRIERRDWPRDFQIQVAFGDDDFNNAWGSHFDLPLDERHHWPSASALAEMKECWEAHGADLILEFAQYRPLFGEMIFDHGLTPAKALKERKSNA